MISQKFKNNFILGLKTTTKLLILSSFVGLLIGIFFINAFLDSEKTKIINNSALSRILSKISEMNNNDLIKDKGILLFLQNIKLLVFLTVFFYINAIKVYFIDFICYQKNSCDKEKATRDKSLSHFFWLSIFPPLITFSLAHLFAGFTFAHIVVLTDQSIKFNNLLLATLFVLFSVGPHAILEFGTFMIIVSLSLSLYFTVKDEWKIEIKESTIEKHKRIFSLIKEIVLSRYITAVIASLYVFLFIAGQIEDKVHPILLEYLKNILK